MRTRKQHVEWCGVENNWVQKMTRIKGLKKSSFNGSLVIELEQTQDFSTKNSREVAIFKHNI